jgi:hypothetical protein
METIHTNNNATNNNPTMEHGLEAYEQLKQPTHTNHIRLNSFSSATSTEETVFSDDDSDDSDSDNDEHEVLSCTSLEDEENEDHHEEAPPFETLVNDGDDPKRAMSFSVNEEMVEVIPTEMVESVVRDLFVDDVKWCYDVICCYSCVLFLWGSLLAAGWLRIVSKQELHASSAVFLACCHDRFSNSFNFS